MDFDKYKKTVEKYYLHDCREINFQNRIVIPFLESLVGEKYEVVDSSTLYKNWKKICRESFAGTYTPDVLVIDEWSLFNDKKQAPSIIIEIKRPTADDRLHANKEVEEYINKAQFVILTDCITWEIKEKGKATQCFYLDISKSNVCERMIPQYIEERKIDWITAIGEDNDWNDLMTRIKGILNINSK